MSVRIFCFRNYWTDVIIFGNIEALRRQTGRKFNFAFFFLSSVIIQITFYEFCQKRLVENLCKI